MFKTYKLFTLVALCVFAVSCKKDKGLMLESLNKAGEEFYFGEKVPVWATTAGGDLNDMTYEWTATGGTFDGFRTQNLFENLWIAPNEPGEYTITVKAKSNGSTSSKSTKMKVTRYYFDEFQSAFTLNGNGWSTSNTTNNLITNTDTAASRLELTASSTSASTDRLPLRPSEDTRAWSYRNHASSSTRITFPPMALPISPSE